MLYDLYSPIPESIKMISDKFKIYLIERGRKIVKACETSNEDKELTLKAIVTNSQIIEKLLGLLVHFKRMIIECFRADPLF